MMGQSASTLAVDNVTMLKPSTATTTTPAPDLEHVSNPDFVADAAKDEKDDKDMDGKNKDEQVPVDGINKEEFLKLLEEDESTAPQKSLEQFASETQRQFQNEENILRERLKKSEEQKPVVDLAPQAFKFQTACANLRKSQDRKKEELKWLTLFGMLYTIFLLFFCVYHVGKHYNPMPFVSLFFLMKKFETMTIRLEFHALLFAINVFLFFEFYMTMWSFILFTCLFFPMIVFQAFEN